MFAAAPTPDLGALISAARRASPRHAVRSTQRDIAEDAPLPVGGIVTQWGLDTLFNPAKRHMDEEKRRLQSTREEIGDNSGGNRIDLESGKVVIRRKRGASGAAGEPGAPGETDADGAEDVDEQDVHIAETAQAENAPTTPEPSGRARPKPRPRPRGA
jgi:hypothetical protein